MARLLLGLLLIYGVGLCVILCARRATKHSTTEFRDHSVQAPPPSPSLSKGEGRGEGENGHLSAWGGAKPTSVMELLGLAFGAGVGTVSLSMFFPLYLGIAPGVSRVVGMMVLPLLGVMGWLLLLVWLPRSLLSRDSATSTPLAGLRPPSPSRGEGRGGVKDVSMLEFLALTVIVVNLALIFYLTMSRPIDGDGKAFWFLKAKILYHEGSLYTSSFLGTDIGRIQQHADYPLLLPIVVSWLAMLLGRFDNTLLKVIYPFFAVSLLMVIYSGLRNFLSRQWALLSIAFLGAVPLLSHDKVLFPSPVPSGYSDLPLAFFYTTAVLCLYRWMQTAQSKDAFTAGFFMAFAVFTKNEGTALFMIGWIALLVFCLREARVQVLQKGLGLFLYTGLPLCVLIPWAHFQSFLPAVDRAYLDQLRFAMILENAHRMPNIIGQFIREGLNFFRWGLLWVVFPLAVLVAVRRGFSSLIYLHLILWLQLLTYALIYVMTPFDLAWHMTTSLSRLLLQAAPLAAFIIAAELFSVADSKVKLRLA